MLGYLQRHDKIEPAPKIKGTAQVGGDEPLGWDPQPPWVGDVAVDAPHLRHPKVGKGRRPCSQSAPNIDHTRRLNEPVNDRRDHASRPQRGTVNAVVEAVVV